MKILKGFLAICLIIGCFASCGTTENGTPTQTLQTTPVVTPTPQPTPTEEPNMNVEHSLEGKTFFFLGSSVTYGSASGGKSFVDYIEDNNHCTCIKVAVSGTTLVDNGSNSYVQRFLKRAERYKDETIDHFICQLSTNDATQNLPLGKISESKNKEDFNTKTIVGAMEYIIAVAQETWGCPVAFYTGPYYNSANYQKMVDALFQLQEKWGIGIIDFWNDEEARQMDAATKRKYMADDIHPTAAGYKEWWTPVFDQYLKTH